MKPVELEVGLWGITASGILVGPFARKGHLFYATEALLKQTDCAGGRDDLDQIWDTSGAVHLMIPGEEMDHIVTVLKIGPGGFELVNGRPPRDPLSCNVIGGAIGFSLQIVYSGDTVTGEIIPDEFSVTTPTSDPPKHKVHLIQETTIATGQYGYVEVMDCNMLIGKAHVTINDRWYTPEELDDTIATLQQVSAAVKEHHKTARKI